MSNTELSEGILDALAQASGAKTGPAMLSQVQASVDSIAALDSLEIKSVEPAVTFSVTGGTLDAAPGGQS